MWGGNRKVKLILKKINKKKMHTSLLHQNRYLSLFTLNFGTSILHQVLIFTFSNKI